VSARAWWQDGLLLLGAALLLVGLGTIIGGALESRSAAQRNATALAEADSAEAVWVRRVAELAARDVERETARAAALAGRDSAVTRADGLAASRRALREREGELRGQLAAAVGQVDSLAGYVALLPTVTARADTAEAEASELRWGLLRAEDAFALEVERSQRLTDRIAIDSLRIVSQARTIAKLITPAPVTSPGRLLGFLPRPTCVAGAGVVGGIRTGSGVGVLCGLPLR
jgi:hypothetical protein